MFFISCASTNINYDEYEGMQKSIVIYQNEILAPARNGEEVCLISNQLKWEYGPDNEIVVTNGDAVRNGYIGLKIDDDMSQGTIYIKYTDINVMPYSVFVMLKPEDCDCVYEIEDVTKDGADIQVSLKSKKDQKEKITLTSQ